jgi:Zn-dependent peptidase ImmA (M78 family)
MQATLESYGWNSRIMRERDLATICEAENVHLSVQDMSFMGFYVEMHEQPAIVLSSRLSPNAFVFVGFHELVHFLQAKSQNKNNKIVRFFTVQEQILAIRDKTLPLCNIYDEYANTIAGKSHQKTFIPRVTPENDEVENTANLIAACALIPRPLVENHSFQELVSGFSYDPRIVQLRLAALEVIGV